MGKYGPEKTPYLETFHAVWGLMWFDKGWDGGSNLSFDLWDLNELQKIMNLEITARKTVSTIGIPAEVTNCQINVSS